MVSDGIVEPWLRGTLTKVDAVRRQVLHALELAREDAERWCAGLSSEQINARPCGIAPVAFHLRHVARSLDRLLSYAEGDELSQDQFAALASELDTGASSAEVLREFQRGIAEAVKRVLNISPVALEQPRTVGRSKLPSTVGGLLIHCAEHTQRHIGQAITTAQVVKGSANRE